MFKQLFALFLVIKMALTGGFHVPQQVQTDNQLKIEIKLLQDRADALESELRLNQSDASTVNRLGASLDIPTPIALFETSLANRISSTATSFTLTSATDKDGNTLASSTYGFIIDEGTASEEFVLADCTSTTCSNVTRGLSVRFGTTTVSALQKEHRRGASVKITDGPQLLIISNMLTGVQFFPNLLTYKSSVPNCIFNDDICDKGYIDTLTVAGGSAAATDTLGFIETAYPFELASQTWHSTSFTLANGRIAIPSNLTNIGYGPWATTSVIATDIGRGGKINPNNVATGTLDAYSWGGVATFTNQLIVPRPASTTFGWFAISPSVTDAYALDFQPVPVLFAGMNFSFVAAATNTDVSTLNPNGLGAAPLRRDRNADLFTNDIIPGNIYNTVYDGANFILQNPSVNTLASSSISRLIISGGDSDPHDFFSMTVPGGTLGARNGIRIKAVISNFGLENDATVDMAIFQLIYGGVTIASTTIKNDTAGAADISALTGTIEAQIFADRPLNEQGDLKINVNGSTFAGNNFNSTTTLAFVPATPSTTTFAGSTVSVGTANINNLANQTLILRVQMGGAQAANSMNITDITAEYLH